MSQPPPVENEQSREVGIEVLKDIAERIKLGEERYGTRLKIFNGRDALVDAYEEVLDLAMYLKQRLMELETLRQWVKTGTTDDT